MMVNPHQPSAFKPERSSAWMQFVRWFFEPPPVRRLPGRDAFVAFVVILAGFAIAGLIAELMPFLRSMAYPTGLAIGCFPFALWLNYCQSRDFTIRDYLGVLLSVFAMLVLQNGFKDLLLVPAAIAIIIVTLPLEIAVGKLILSSLPGSKDVDDEYTD